jgi:hypothetical protein
MVSNRMHKPAALLQFLFFDIAIMDVMFFKGRNTTSYKNQVGNAIGFLSAVEAGSAWL